VIDVLLVALFASPAYVAVIVWFIEVSVFGGCVASIVCVPADNVVVAGVVNEPLETAPDPSDADVVVSVIVMFALPVTATPVDVTFAVAVNVTDEPKLPVPLGVVVIVVVVGTAAADAIDVCATYAKANTETTINANKTLRRASMKRTCEIVETKTPFRSPREKSRHMYPVVGIRRAS
jgi:hypothetical protein